VSAAVAGQAWLGFALGLAGILGLYGTTLVSMARDWAAFPNLSHGFAIPPIAVYLAWTRRSRLAQLVGAPSWVGCPFLAGGLALYAGGVLGAEPFLARISLHVTLLGAALFLLGRDTTRELGPSLAYLVFMTPLPYITLKKLTDATRVFDAAMTAAVLPWLGVPVLREGVILHLSRISLEVADVCSSIPAIASLLALAAAYGLVRRRSPLICLVLLLAAVPLGLASNVIRIIVTAAGAHYIGPVALHNAIHLWSGTTVFLMTFSALVLLDAGLCRLRLEPAMRVVR
jgi:exosortase